MRLLGLLLFGAGAWLVAKRMPAMREFLPGGRAAGRRPSDFDAEQLKIGTQVELEHTPDPRVAQEIAMDHLAEDPAYYTKLVRAGL